MKHISNLFKGPTPEQYEVMKRRQAAESRYMEWVFANRDADLATCDAKYKELTKNI